MNCPDRAPGAPVPGRPSRSRKPDAAPGRKVARSGRPAPPLGFGFAAEADPGAPSPGAATPETSAGRADTAAAPRRLRVLVVEDEAIIAMELEDLLAELDAEVVATAIDAEEAVALADAHRPDLVTMDINLGRGRDGISAAIEILQLFGIRSIFVSAYGNPETRARAEPARPAGWVSKPISRSRLEAALNAALPDRSR